MRTDPPGELGLIAMTVEHDPAAAYDDVNVRSIAVVGCVGAVLVFTAIAAVQVIYFKYRQSEYEQKVLAVPTSEQNAVLSEQWRQIETGTLPADAPKGEKGIPLKEAMSLVLSDYRKDRPEDAEKTAGEKQAEKKTSDESAAKTNDAATGEAESNDGRPADEKKSETE